MIYKKGFNNISFFCIGLYLVISCLLQNNIYCYTSQITPDSLEPGLGHIMRWNLSVLLADKIPYVINPNRPARSTPVLPEGTTAAAIIRDIQNGFQVWENIKTSKIGFVFSGITNQSDTAIDGTNLVTMEADPLGEGNCSTAFTRVVSCLEAGTCILPNGKTIKIDFPGQIVDADIIFCTGEDSDTISIDGSADADLQARTTHEVGHFLGFGHTGILPDTMYGYVSFDNVGIANRSRQTLSTNDEIGASVFYPAVNFIANTGSIRGTVLDADSRPIFGGHVVVINVDGVVVADTLTGLLKVGADGIPDTFSMASGDYMINGLPPGRYSLYVAPLDGPPAGATNSGFFDVKNIRLDFAPTFFPDTVTVSERVTVNGIDFQVPALKPGAPNIDVLTFTDPPTGFIASGVGYYGTDHVMAMEAGENIVSSNGDLISGTTFEISGIGVSIKDNPFVDEGFIFIPISVGSNIPIGARNITVKTQNGSSVLGGGLIIAESPPSIAAISPTSGPTGTLLTITGTGFLPDTIVTIEGKMADSIDINSLNNITIKAPPPFSGSVNSADILVRNDAGTSILKDAFTYVTGKATPTPVPSPTPISTLTPASTPSPIVTPTPVSILSDLTVEPTSAKRSLFFKDAIIKALDQDSRPLPNVRVNAAANGTAVKVSPASAVTQEDGTARFRFRFGLLSKDGEIVFTADGLRATIGQE